MKSYYALPLLVAYAVAQDACGIVVPVVADLPADVQVLAQGQVNINGTTIVLNNTISSFTGPADTTSLATAAGGVLASINDANTAAQGVAPFTEDNKYDAVNLAPFVGSLACTVNATVFNLIDKKTLFVDSCLGPLVLATVEQQQAAAGALINTTLSKITDDLRDLAGSLAQPILDALSTGSSAFADQTTTPASCASTTTSATTTTAGTVTTTGASTGPTSTGAATTKGSATWADWNAKPTSTTKKPETTTTVTTKKPETTTTTASEDCDDDDETWTTTATTKKPETTTGVSSTWAVWTTTEPAKKPETTTEPAKKPETTTEVSSTWAVWTTTSEPAKKPQSSTWAVWTTAGGNGGSGSANPSGNGGSGSGSANPSGYGNGNGAAQSSGYVNPAKTSTAPISTFTGAAVANGVNMIEAAALAALAAAALL